MILVKKGPTTEVPFDTLYHPIEVFLQGLEVIFNTLRILLELIFPILLEVISNILKTDICVLGPFVLLYYNNSLVGIA